MADDPEAGAANTDIDTGLACLVLIARLHGVAAEAAQLAHEFGTGQPFGVSQILLAAKRLDLKARAVDSDVRRIDKLPLPAIALGEEDAGGRPGFFVLARAEGEQVLIQDPAAARPKTLSRAELRARWPGRAILFASRAGARAEHSRFDFTWFIPAIVKYRALLIEVLLVSFALQLFGLLTPLFFQVVMDKVLVHRGCGASTGYSGLA